MQKILFLLIAAAVAAGCSNKRNESDASRKADKKPADKTEYVVCGKMAGDSVTVTPVGSDGSMTYSVAGASVSGGLTVGDTLAVIADGNKKELVSAININSLTGLWMFGDGGDGLRISPDGSAGSVGSTKDVTFRSWAIGDGRLVLKYIKADGSDYTEVPETVRIDRLDADSMTIEFRSETLRYKRTDGLITAH